jgi:hypothetical protein
MLPCIFNLLISKGHSTPYRDSLCTIMRQHGIPKKLIQMVKTLYKDSQLSAIDWWLITSIYGFTSRSRTFHLHGDVTIAGEGLQNVCLYARRSGSFSREGSLSCHTSCDTGPRFFRSHPKDRSIQSPLTTRMGMQGPYLLNFVDVNINVEFLSDLRLVKLRLNEGH